MSRVVVTGIGVVSPIGSGRMFWRNLTAGRSGIGPITVFDASSLPVRIGGEVKDLEEKRLAAAFPRASGLRDRKVWLGLRAAEEAVADAGIDEEVLRGAVLHVGAGLEAFPIERVTGAAAAGGLGAALSRSILESGDELKTPLDRLAEVLGDRHGFLGGRTTNCSACAAGAQTIGEAFLELREGAAAAALAGAADSMLNPLGLGGFGLLGVLSAENDRPASACRPFDRTRQGTVLGEGAAFLVLETLEAARTRGARIIAEVLGYGSSFDAYRVSDPAPDGGGAILCMRRALRDAGLRPEDVDCVNAHGTGTPKNDIVEALAIREVLGARAREVPVHAVKSMTGHLIAASGAVEAAAAILTVSARLVPPTANLEEQDPACDLDVVRGEARPFDGEVVLSNSFGFGGQNASIIFGRHER
jgi:3-oxoacyl-[acyl-carrier-protein] synthase II